MPFKLCVFEDAKSEKIVRFVLKKCTFRFCDYINGSKILLPNKFNPNRDFIETHYSDFLNR